MVMSEHLQVVLDIVTGEVSFRHAWRERPAAKLLKPPSLLEMPTSVLGARQESGFKTGHNVADAWRLRHELPEVSSARNAADRR
jgi:hypothetical protein